MVTVFWIWKAAVKSSSEKNCKRCHGFHILNLNSDLNSELLESLKLEPFHNVRIFVYKHLSYSVLTENTIPRFICKTDVYY